MFLKKCYNASEILDATAGLLQFIVVAYMHAISSKLEITMFGWHHFGMV